MRRALQAAASVFSRVRLSTTSASGCPEARCRTQPLRRADHAHRQSPEHNEKIVDALSQSATAATTQLVVFELHEQRYALRLAVVERIVRIAAITALPAAPAIVLGIVNIQGRLVPVVDPRTRFGLPLRDVELSDHLIVARTSRRPVALQVDAVEGVVTCTRSQLATAEGAPFDARYVEGVLKLEDGLVLIHDLDTFLSPIEDRQLAQALASG